MRRQDVQPSPETISCLLESCAHGLQSGSPSNPKDNQHLQRALRLYRWMDASSPSPTITSQHQKSTLPPIQPPKMNRFHINAILKCCSRAGDYSSMIAIYQAMNHVRSPLRATPAVDKDESDHLTEFVREKRREAKDRRRRARNQQQIQDGLILERDSAIVSDTHSDGDWISQRLENFMHDSTNTPDEILQDTETDVVGRSQLIRPDAATYSILLSAFARMGGEDGYTKALQIWKDVSQDAEQSVAIVLKQRELFFKARLEKNRKSSLDSEVLRITKNSKHSVKRTNKCVELSEEEYLEYMTREDARLEADLAFPVRQL
jgi:pentatricopeptide repeat protein